MRLLVRRVATLLMLASGAAGAQAINNGATGLAGTFLTIDFNNLAIAEGASVTTQLSPFGVQFEDAYYGASSNYGGGVFTTAALYNFTAFQTQTFTGTLNILFNTPVTGAAFNLATIPGTTTFNFFLGGNSVFSFQGATGGTLAESARWWGAQGILFDRINLTLQSPQFGTAIGLDNLEIETHLAPEPSTFILGAAGLLGLAVARRRRKR